MKDCTIRTGTISISDLPFLKDYEEVKKRLSIRLVNRIKIKPEAVYKLYLDFGVTCHIDVSDLVGDDATCMVKRGLLEYMGVEKARLFADAIENSMKIRPAVAVPIETYIGQLFFLDTMLDFVPAGWQNLFLEMCEKIRQELTRTDEFYRIRFFEIKEKYGSLRLAATGGNRATDAIIDRCEKESQRICVQCGKPATRISQGWICPFCDDCIGNRASVAIE